MATPQNRTIFISIVILALLSFSGLANHTSMGMTAFWTNNAADDLTVEFGDAATVRATFTTTTSQFWYSMTVIDLLTGEVLGGRTEGPLSTTPNFPNTRYLTIPDDVAVPEDRVGDYRVTVIAWNDIGGRITNDLDFHVRGNHAPVLTVTPLSATIGEGDSVTITVEGTDVDDNPLTLVISGGQPSGSVFSLISDEAGHLVKSFTWIPSFTQAGTYDVRFRLADGTAIDTETVPIIVTDNAAPTISGLTDSDGTILDTTAETNEGDVFIVNIESNDLEGDSVSYEAYRKQCRGGICIRYSLPEEMDLDTTNGILTFSPEFDYVEHPRTEKTQSVYFRAYDGDRYSVERRLILTTNDVNQQPQSLDQTITLNEDSFVDIVLQGTDADSEDETAGFSYIVTNPVRGILSGTAPLLQYTPTVNYAGSDQFTFTVTDQMGSTSPRGTVRITVIGINDAPTLVIPDVSVAEDTIPATLIDLRNYAHDADHPLELLLPFTLVSETNTTVIDCSLDADGFTLRCQTQLNQFGDSNITVSVQDPLGATVSDMFTITVTPVNDLPALAIPNQTMAEDSLPLTLDLQDYTTDVDNVAGDFSYDVPYQSNSILVNCAVAAGSTQLVCTPQLNQFGTSTVHIQVMDRAGGASIDTFVVAVEPVNDHPQAEDDDTYIVAEDASLTVAAPGVLGNDFDVERDVLAARVVGAGVSSGMLMLNIDGSFTYIPNANFNGVDTFTYEANDGHGGEDTATVTITVTPINDAPVLADDILVVDEDLSGTIDVFANDADVDSPLAISSVTQGASGSVAFTLAGSVTYTPNVNYNGADSFTYTVVDGLFTSTATVHVTVNSVNDDPVAVNDAYTIDEDAELSVSAPGTLANDRDIDGGALTAVVDSLPANGGLVLDLDGSFMYGPDHDFTGVDSFTYHATDGAGNSNVATVTITVNEMNDAPVADDDAVSVTEDEVNGDIALSLLDGDADVDSGFILINSVDDTLTEGSVSVDLGGNVLYTPSAAAQSLQVGETRTDTFTYTLSDGSLTSSPATVTVTITGLNDAPVFTSAPLLDTEEDLLYTYTARATDVEGDSLTFTATSLPGWLMLVDNGDGTSTLSGTPNNADVGAHDVTLTVNDGTVTVEQSFTITVGNVNDAPDAVDDEYTTHEDDTSFTGNVLDNDSDAEGDTLTATLLTVTDRFTLAVDGEFAYSPGGLFDYLVLGETAVETFTYSVSDSNGGTDEATVIITIQGIDDPVVAVNDAFATDEDTALANLDVLDNDLDAEGAEVYVSSVDATSFFSALVTRNADDTLNYDPRGALDYLAEGESIDDSFTYTATDGGTDTAVVTVTVTGVNDAPVLASIGDKMVNEGELLSFTLAASDPEGNGLVFTFASAPEVAGASINPTTEEFSWTPSFDQAGIYVIMFTVTDGDLTDTETITITVNDLNRAPVFTEVADLAVPENTFFTFTVEAIDPDGDAITFSTGSLPIGATFGPSTGMFSWIPDFTVAADSPYTITFTATDDQAPAGSSTMDVLITVTNTNRAPVAENDEYTTDEDGSLEVETASGVLANDADADGEALTAILDTDAADGTLTLNTDGSFTYTPDLNFNGVDSFIYRATDGVENSETATVTITVNPVNDAPILDPIGDKSIDENAELTFTLTASDVEGGVLEFGILGITPDGATLDPATGEFTWTPTFDQSQNYLVWFTVTDGELFDEEVIIITVNNINRAPVANAQSFAVDEDQVLSDAVEGSDVDGDGLTFALGTDVSNGDLTFNDDGSFVYTPSLNFNGADSFTYITNDGTADSSPATVSITVNPINDAPTVVDDAYATDEDITLTINAASGVLANDADEEGNSLTAVLASGPSHGFLALNSDGSFVYTPNANFNGVDTFTYVANDGASDSNVATVTITVGNVNDAPVAIADSYNTDEDTPLMVGSVSGVLANDADPDGDALTVVLDTDAQYGTLALNDDGSFTYTPNLDFVGTDSFTYTANDGTEDSAPATVTITVGPVNDAPVADSQTVSVAEDSTNNPITLSGSDVDGDTLTFAIIATPAHGTLGGTAPNVLYTPAADYNGPDSFSFTVNDGTPTSALATVSITVGPLNDAPVANDDTASTDEDTPATIAVLANDLDADGDTLTVQSVTTPTAGTASINIDNTITYTPAADASGTASFTYTISDGNGGTDTATVTVTISSENDAPVFTVALSDVTTPEDVAVTINLNNLVSDAEDADAALDFVVDSSNTAVVTCTITAGQLTCTPVTDQIGTSTITVQVTDTDGASTSDSFTLTVTEVSDAPTFTTTSLPAATAGQSYTSLLEATDLEGAALTFTAAGLPAWLTLRDNGNNTATLSGTPANADVGADTFTITVQENPPGGLSTTQTFTITIVANPSPSAVNDAYTLMEETTLTVAAPGVLVNDADPDGEALTAVLSSNPRSGTLLFNADGSFTYTPNTNFQGIDTFTYRASDGTSLSAPATVRLTVQDINDAPTITSTPPTTAIVGQPYTYQIQVQDESSVTFNFVTVPEGMTVGSSGLVRWIPDESGRFTVTVQVQDTNGLTISQSWTIHVEKASQELKIMSVHLSDEEVQPGDSLLISLSLENRGNVDMRNAHVEAIIPDLGLKQRSSRFTLKQGDQKKGTLRAYIPYDAEPGEYLLKVTLENGRTHEVAYRLITVSNRSLQ